MRRWAVSARAALDLVADRPGLWLPGALAWLASVGWAPFLLVVARPPTQSELTYFGAGLQSSGLWPLNLVLLAAGVVALVGVAVAAVAMGNAWLTAALEHRPPRADDAARLIVTALIGVLPVALAAFAVLIATIAIAPIEFNRPETETGPVARTVLRLAPLLAGSAIVVVASATVASLAGRASVAAGSIGQGLADLPALARRGGAAAVTHVAATALGGIGFLLVAWLLLRVLWAPIAALLSTGGPIGAAAVLLLLGFVAIWLCLVLAGGALHAWGSATWSLLLAPRPLGRQDQPQETFIAR